MNGVYPCVVCGEQVILMWSPQLATQFGRGQRAQPYAAFDVEGEGVGERHHCDESLTLPFNERDYEALQEAIAERRRPSARR